MSTAVLEETSLHKQWRESKDKRNKTLPKPWRYIAHATVSNGEETIHLTSGINKSNVKEHIGVVVARRTAASQSRPELVNSALEDDE